jgi:hypothetical protein
MYRMNGLTYEASPCKHLLALIHINGFTYEAYLEEAKMQTKGRLERVEFEQVRIRVLPGNRVIADDAAVLLDRAPKTLAMWRMRGEGPPYEKRGRRVYYTLEDLEDYDAATTLVKGARRIVPAGDPTPPAAGNTKGDNPAKPAANLKEGPSS